MPVPVPAVPVPVAGDPVVPCEASAIVAEPQSNAAARSAVLVNDMLMRSPVEVQFGIRIRREMGRWYARPEWLVGLDGGRDHDPGM